MFISLVAKKRTKEITRSRTFYFADSYRKKMLKCGKKFGVIKDFFNIDFMFVI